MNGLTRPSRPRAIVSNRKRFCGAGSLILGWRAWQKAQLALTLIRARWMICLLCIDHLYVGTACYAVMVVHNQVIGASVRGHSVLLDDITVAQDADSFSGLIMYRVSHTSEDATAMS